MEAYKPSSNCKTFVTLQLPKSPRSLSRKAGGRFRGAIPTASGGLTGEGGNPAYPNRFQSPLIPLFGLYPSSSTFPKRERKRKVYLLGKRAYYHVYCKSFVTLQSPKAPRSLSRKAGGELRACPVPIAIGNGRAASPKSPPEFIPQGGRGVVGAV